MEERSPAAVFLSFFLSYDVQSTFEYLYYIFASLLSSHLFYFGHQSLHIMHTSTYVCMCVCCQLSSYIFCSCRLSTCLHSYTVRYIKRVYQPVLWSHWRRNKVDARVFFFLFILLCTVFFFPSFVCTAFISFFFAFFFVCTVFFFLHLFCTVFSSVFFVQSHRRRNINAQECCFFFLFVFSFLFFVCVLEA